MFTELMPLLAGRTVLITVAKVDDKTLRVNIIPHAKADGNPALTTPLTDTGPPEELDAQFGKHLASYVQIHQHSGKGQGHPGGCGPPLITFFAICAAQPAFAT